MDMLCFFFFELYGDHRDLHLRTHSFPTRRSSDLGGNVLVEVASRPEAGAAVLAREGGHGPHDVDEIFEATLRAFPHVLVAVGHLRKGAGVDLDRLGQVECDPLTSWQQHLLSDREDQRMRSEEHTSEIQSLMRISYAVFCFQK